MKLWQCRGLVTVSNSESSCPQASKGVKVLLQLVGVLIEMEQGPAACAADGVDAVSLQGWLQLLNVLHTLLNLQAACLKLLAGNQAAWPLAA